MSAHIVYGKGIFGTPKNDLPTKGFLAGKLEIIKSKEGWLFARVETHDGVRDFYIKEEEGFWVPWLEKVEVAKQ